jgi:hypothetical protein
MPKHTGGGPPIVDSVLGIDIWKEGEVYEIYDNMVPLKEYSSLSRARDAARQYAKTGTLL